MKYLTRLIVCIVISLFLLIYYLYWSTNIVPNITISPKNDQKAIEQKNDIYLAVVACGDRVQEVLNMIKSALIFTQVPINIIVVAEDKLRENFIEKLTEWQELLYNKFQFNVLPLTFTIDNVDEWRKLFKPCAAQRLFLPDVLKDIDSILYVDTDVLFLTPVEQVWSHFKKMNSSQMVALAPESEDRNIGWYSRFAKHPYYGVNGVNSGVMLMNLTKMRDFKWIDYVVSVYKQYKLHLTWGDQDIINIIFSFHPDKLYIYSCRYNFRSDHCMYMSLCKKAEKEGIAVIHGSRGIFHSDSQPAFKQVYRAFEEFQLGDDLNSRFLQPLEVYLELTGHTNCGKIKEAYLKNIKKYIT